MDNAHHLILLGGSLGVLSICAALLSHRIGTPLLLAFLALGMLAGREGPLGISFTNLQAAYLIGSTALAIILFEGGLKVHDGTLRAALWPALALATAGTAITACLVAGAFLLVMAVAPPQPAWPHPAWTLAVLVGASMAPTDAAAVSALLSRARANIPPRLLALLEMESGLNDPVSVFLVVLVTKYLVTPAHVDAWQALLLLLREMGGGTLLGLAGGWFLARALRRVRAESALCPVLALMGALTLFGLAQILEASGFLAVFLAGMVVGREVRTAQAAIRSFFEAFGWLAQIVLFLMLGMLVAPHELLAVAMLGSIFSVALLVLLARAAACLACLLPFGFSIREVSFASWVGLRGAVPIYLTTIPALARVEGAELMLTPTCVVVVTSLVVQGWTIKPATRLLGAGLKHPSAGR